MKKNFILRKLLAFVFLASSVMLVNASQRREDRDLNKAIEESLKYDKRRKKRENRDLKKAIRASLEEEKKRKKKKEVALNIRAELRKAAQEREMRRGTSKNKKKKKTEKINKKKTRKKNKKKREREEELDRFEEPRRELGFNEARVSLVEQLVAVNNPDCLVKNLAKNIVVVQMNVLHQSRARCGSHAFKNSDALCYSSDIKSLYKQTGFSSKDIRKHVREIKKSRKELFGYVKENKLMSKEYKKYCKSGGMMSYEEMMRYNKNQVCCKVGPVYRTIFEKTKSMEKLLGKKVICEALTRFSDAKRCRYTPVCEVFIVNTSGHWITIRVERMSNGNIGILLLDSVWLGEDDEVVDKIKAYKKWLLPFASLFV